MNPNLIVIRERIKKLVSLNENSNFIQPQTNIEVRNKNFMTFFLGICILVLSAATAWAILHKKTDNIVEKSPVIANVDSSSISSPFKLENQPIVNEKLKDNHINEIDQKLNDLNNKMEIWAKRTWLLGVSHNENVNLNRQLQAVQGFQDPGYIVFDESWNFNRIPSTLQLTEEQKNAIGKNVK